MEYNITIVEYEVIDNGVVKHSGTCPSFLLNTITDTYCDFKNSPYTLKVRYNGREFSVASDADYSYRDDKLIMDK